MEVRLVEVGPRDGLQNESATISVADKVNLIELLQDAGHTHIEVGAFVHPKWVPQMADTDKVWQGLKKLKHVHYSVLLPNKKGYDQAVANNVQEIAIFIGASETFNQKNSNADTATCLQRFQEFVPQALTAGMPVRAYISTAFGCPYEGDISSKQVLGVVEKILAMTSQNSSNIEFSISDTIGVAHPKQVSALVQDLEKIVEKSKLTLHFHDTYGKGLVNVYAGLEAGITTFDTSTGGLGGCPYADGATGNVATEDVVNFLNDLGMKTAIDLEKQVAAALFIQERLGKTLPSRYLQAVSR